VLCPQKSHRHPGMGRGHAEGLHLPRQGLRLLPRDLRRQVSPRKNPGPGLPTSPRRTQQNVRLSDLPETVTAELWRRFNAMLQPLVETKKMGAVLVQFHTSFGPSKANEDHVRYIRARLRKDVAMAVEFRNRKWLDTQIVPGLGGSRLDRTCSLLADIKAVLVASDDLLHEVQQKDRNQRGLPKGSARVRLEPVLRDCVDQNSKSSLFDPPFAFCRVHRRHGTNRLLRSEELKDWSLKLNNFTGSGNPVKSTSNPHRGPIYFLWGTDHLDQPIRNRRALDSLLPKALRFDWRQHVRDTEATQPGTLLGMFAQATRNQISPGKSESKDRRIPKQSHVRSLTDPAAGPNKRKEKPCRQSNVPKRQKKHFFLFLKEIGPKSSRKSSYPSKLKQT